MKITGLEPARPFNLVAFEAAYRASEIEFWRTGVWSFTWDAAAPANAHKKETK